MEAKDEVFLRREAQKKTLLVDRNSHSGFKHYLSIPKWFDASLVQNSALVRYGWLSCFHEKQWHWFKFIVIGYRGIVEQNELKYQVIIVD